MVDGFRWKPILRANQCGSAKEVLCLRPWSQDGWPSFRLAITLLFLCDTQSVVSPLSLTCVLQPFFLIALLTFSHRDRGPLMYACIVWEFHEPWTQGHVFLIFFPITAPLHFHLTLFGCVIHLFFLILSTICLSHILSTLSGEPPQFITWRIVTSFPPSISRTLVQRSLV